MVIKMREFQYDTIVIGFGKGGKTLAAKLAGAGEKVALIEKDDSMYGGTCINVGCIPSKSLIHSAARVQKEASFAQKQESFLLAVKEKRRLIEMLRQKNYDKLNQLDNVTIYHGQGRFVGPRRVEVAGMGETIVLQGEKVLINTGSVPFLPPIPGLDKTNKVYTSAELMDVETLPRRLVIIGGGYIGLEFASMFAAFGSQVTVVQDSGTFLPGEDRDVANAIQAMLQEQGVKLWLNAKTQRIENGANGPVLTVLVEGKERELAADAVLVATGRVPNTKDLNCEAAFIDLTPRGAVVVDEFLRSTAPGVWAMGDVTGGPQHTYISLDDSRIIWDQLTGKGSKNIKMRPHIPYSVFLKIPYSRVGMNETEALASGRSVRIARLPAGAIPKAQVLGAAEGLLKAVIDAETDEILGVMLLCEESYETINVVKVAMDLHGSASFIQNQIFTHPTMTEALNDLFA